MLTNALSSVLFYNNKHGNVTAEGVSVLPYLADNSADALPIMKSLQNNT